jgi:hypothetical protein
MLFRETFNVSSENRMKLDGRITLCGQNEELLLLKQVVGLSMQIAVI